MFNFSGSEIFFLLILGLVILGPEKLPGVIRKAGKLYGEFRRITTDAQGEFKDVFGDTIGELKDTAQGYKSMFDSASREANSTIAAATHFDTSASTPAPATKPKDVVEPKFVPFDIGLPGETDEQSPAS